MEETHQDSPSWAWLSSFSQLDNNITLAGYDPRDNSLVLEGNSFLVSTTQHAGQSQGAVPTTIECYHTDVPTVDSQASFADTLTPKSYANIATNDQDFPTGCPTYDEGLTWPSFGNAPQSSDTMSVLDLRFTHGASLWPPPTKDNSDPWIDNAGILSASLELNSANNLGLDQGSLWVLNNGLCNNLPTEGAILDFPSKCIEFHPNDLPGNSPGSSSIEPRGSSPWSLLSSHSPCSESQGTNYRDSLSSQSACSESPISPGFPEHFYAPPALSDSSFVREFPIKGLIPSIGDYMPGPFSFVSIPTESPIPEPRPNESHSQQTPPSRLKARDQRKILLPEKCPVCHKGHQYKNDVKRHIRTRHKKYAREHKIAEDPFICDLCQRKYTRSDRLCRHKRLKHGLPPRMKK